MQGAAVSARTNRGAAPAIIENSHVQEKRNCYTGFTELSTATCGAGGVADALCAFHDSRVRRQRAERRGDRARARKDSRSVQVKKGSATGASTFAVSDRRCADIAAVRLPGATGAIVERDWQGGGRAFALLATRGTRDWVDEQAPRI